MATPPPDRPELLENEQVVRDILDAAKGRVAHVSVAAAACGFGTAFLAYVLGFVVADHALDGGLPAVARTVVGALVLAGSAVWLAGWIILPLSRRVGDLYAAHLLERRHRLFRNSLVNAVQLGRHTELPGSVRAALMARAATDAVAADVFGAITPGRLLQMAKLACVVVVLFILYAALAAKPVLPSVARALGLPRPAPTRTVVVELEPEDGKSIVTGKSVNFVAQLGGRRPSEASIEFSMQPGGPIIEGQRLRLADAGRGPRATGHVWQGAKAGADLQQTLYWRLLADDAPTSWRRLEVRPYPDIVSLRVIQTPPPYTQIPPLEATGADAGEISAVEGTQVAIEANTNVPIRDPVLVMAPAANPADETPLLMNVAGTAKDRIAGGFTVREGGRYWLRFFDKFGERNQNPVRYEVRVRQDRPPSVKLEWPASDLAMAPGETLTIAGSAEDDFGISRVEIEYQVRSRAAAIPLRATATSPDTRPSTPVVTVKQSLAVASFNAKLGDVIEWRLVAWDNRADSAGLPTPQKGAGPLRRIAIREPEALAKAVPTNKPDTTEPPPTSKPAPEEPKHADKPGDGGKPDADQGTNEPGKNGTAAAENGTGTPEIQIAANDGNKDGNGPEAEKLKKFLDEHKEEIAKLQEHLGTDKPDGGNGDKKQDGEKASTTQTAEAEADAKNPGAATQNAKDAGDGPAATTRNAKNADEGSAPTTRTAANEGGEPAPTTRNAEGGSAPGNKTASAKPVEKADAPKPQTPSNTSSGNRRAPGMQTITTELQSEGGKAERETLLNADGKSDEAEPADSAPKQGPSHDPARPPSEEGKETQPRGNAQPGAPAGGENRNPSPETDKSQTNPKAPAGSPSDRPAEANGSPTSAPSDQADGGGTGDKQSPPNADSQAQPGEKNPNGEPSQPQTGQTPEQATGDPPTTGEQGQMNQPTGTGQQPSDSTGSPEESSKQPAGQTPEGSTPGSGQQPGESASKTPGQGSEQAPSEKPEGSGQQPGDSPGSSQTSGSQDAGSQPQATAAEAGTGQQPGQTPGEGGGQPEKSDSPAKGSGQAGESSSGEKGQGQSGETGSGQQPGQGQGQSKGEGGEQGKDGKPPGEGQSESQSDSSGSKSSGQGESKSDSEGKGQDGQGQDGKGDGQGKSDKIPPKTTDSAGSSPGAPLNAPQSGDKPTGEDTTVEPQDKAAPPSSAAPAKLDTIGEVFKVVDALEQQLRKKELDPALLQDLGWDATKADQFVREFRRVAAPAPPRDDGQTIPDSQFETTAKRQERTEKSSGVRGDSAPLSARDTRKPDQTKKLSETGRQNVPREYRDLVNEYYQSVNRQRTTTTRPAR